MMFIPNGDKNYRHTSAPPARTLYRPKMRWLMLVLGYATAMASFSAPAPKTIPVALENFPPFEFEHEGKIIGIDTEIVVQVLQRLGYHPEFRILPWTRAQKFVQEGKMAALYSLTKTPEREKFYYFSEPLSYVRDVFYKRKEADVSWTVLRDLKHYRIGSSLGYSYAPVFMEAVKSKILENIDEIAGENLELRNLRRIKAKRIDLAICEISVCQYLIKMHAPEFDMIDHIDRSIGKVRPYHIGFSKNWPGAKKLAQQFNTELSKLIAEGKRKKIFEKYGAAGFPEKLESSFTEGATSP